MIAYDYLQKGQVRKKKKSVFPPTLNRKARGE